MGLEFFLYKIDKKERFIMGKGNWYNCFPFEKIFILHNIHKIPSNLQNQMISDNYFFEFQNEKDKILYFSNLATKLFNWTKDDRLEFLNDEIFYDKYKIPKNEINTWREWYDKNYPVTGTRYIENDQILNIKSFLEKK